MACWTCWLVRLGRPNQVDPSRKCPLYTFPTAQAGSAAAEAHRHGSLMNTRIVSARLQSALRPHSATNIDEAAR